MAADFNDQSGGEEMEENRYSSRALTAMKNLNLLIILYISVLAAFCLSGIVQENSAAEFLARIPVLPGVSWRLPLAVLCLYCGFLFLMAMENQTSMDLFLKVCLETGIGFYLSYILGFSYTGIILLILADAMQYFPKAKWRFPLAVLVCMAYLLLNYQILSAYFSIVPFETYLTYFRPNVQGILSGIKNAADALNTFIFLVYMILLMREQTSEKERIMNLNQQLNQANSELKMANLQLEEYAKTTEKMVETRERNRLAREIHDTLGHALTGIITGLEACTVLMDLAPDAAKAQMAAITEVARQGMTDVRRSVKALRPDMLEKFDLEKALASTIKEMRLATNAQIQYTCTTELNGFNDDEEEIIYRIVQESITNSIRHGKASSIDIWIDRQFNMLKIKIQDNGIGCKDIQKGFGLHHMEERLTMLKGTLSCSGENGFLIEAMIPIRWGTEGEEK